MIVYILATALTCFLVWFGERQERKWPWRICAALPLMIVAAIRWDVGTDFYHTYYPASLAFECIKGGSLPDQIDKAFAPLMRRLGCAEFNTPMKLYGNFVSSVKCLGPGYRSVMEVAWWFGGGIRTHMAVFAILTGILVFVAIYRQSKWPVFAAFLYVTTSNYFLSLNIVRQYFAVVIGLVAVEFVRDRKPLPFFACIAFAALFHPSVLVLLPLYFVGRIELRFKWCALLILAAAAAAPFAAPAAVWGLETLGMHRYAGYFQSEYRTDGFEWMFFAVNAAFMVFGGWYWERAKKVSPYFIIWYNMTVIGTIFLAFSGSFPLMKRINYYFAAPQFLLLPEILLAESRLVLRKVLTALVIVGFLLESAVAVWMFNKNEPLPYCVTRHPKHVSPRGRFASRPFEWMPKKKVSRIPRPSVPAKLPVTSQKP